MATYTAITAGQIDAESYIDTTLAGQWTNNLIASFEKASGAPVLANDYVVEAMMADAAVDRGTLDTATVSLSGSIIEQSRTYITMNAYAFFPMIHQTLSGSDINGHGILGHNTDGASADNPRFGFFNNPKAGNTSYDVDYRHVDDT